MDNWFFYSAIRSVSLQLCDAFTGLKIAKTDEEGNVTNWVDVPLKFGLKDKWWYFLKDKKDHIQYPIMGLSMTQAQFDQNRGTQKLGRVRLPNNPDGTPVDNKKIIEMLNPSPWRFTYQLQIATKTQIEIEQILEQTLPFFNPFLSLYIPIPAIQFGYDAKVILGNVSPDTNESLDADSTRPITWKIEMTVDGYLFKPVEEVKTIHKIITQFIDSPAEQVLAQHILDGTKDPTTSKLLHYYWDKDEYLT